MIDYLAVSAIAVGLAMDATAVAIACSVTLGRVSARQVFRLAFHFGLFQATMPLIGWLAGRALTAGVQAWDHWVAFGLLTAIGLRAINDGLARRDDTPTPSGDPTRGLSLVSLSVATSIDALAAGMSFALLRVTVWQACAVIGVITAALTVAGMLLGSRLGSALGRRMQAVGGVALVLVGAKIVASHM
ncbi:MAG TPA: manganese efflux pump MntP family protein [Chthonomonadales bacterium]|nr:manganese efflux pump MntP family protein [Chthonomonadales bacterium]